MINYTQKLLAGTLALVLVAGLGNQAFAGGFSCTIDPTMEELQLGANEVSDPTQVTITCNEDIDDMGQNNDCALNALSTPNETNDPRNTRTFELIVSNLGDTSEEHCTLNFNVLNGDPIPDFIVSIDLWINEPKPVAGELISPDSSALVVAGLASSAVWMIPVVAGITGAGIYLIKLRATRD